MVAIRGEVRASATRSAFSLFAKSHIFLLRHFRAQLFNRDGFGACNSFGFNPRGVVIAYFLLLARFFFRRFVYLFNFLGTRKEHGVLGLKVKKCRSEIFKHKIGYAHSLQPAFRSWLISIQSHDSLCLFTADGK